MTQNLWILSEKCCDRLAWKTFSFLSQPLQVGYWEFNITAEDVVAGGSVHVCEAPLFWVLWLWMLRCGRSQGPEACWPSVMSAHCRCAPWVPSKAHKERWWAEPLSLACCWWPEELTFHVRLKPCDRFIGEQVAWCYCGNKSWKTYKH